MDLLTDNAIMLNVKNGDLDKMGLLFERHHLALYGFLFYMTGQRQASEDIVQNVFYRMLKYRHTYKGNGEFKTWMYHLARNLVKDYAKRNKKKNGEYELSGLEDKISGGMLPDERIQKQQELYGLRKAMDQLSEDSREILILSRFQELKYEEIARITGISESAVKVRVHRAMNQLKTIYLKTENREQANEM